MSDNWNRIPTWSPNYRDEVSVWSCVRTKGRYCECDTCFIERSDEKEMKEVSALKAVAEKAVDEAFERFKP